MPPAAGARTRSGSARKGRATSHSGCNAPRAVARIGKRPSGPPVVSHRFAPPAHARPGPFRGPTAPRTASLVPRAAPHRHPDASLSARGAPGRAPGGGRGCAPRAGSSGTAGPPRAPTRGAGSASTTASSRAGRGRTRGTAAPPSCTARSKRPGGSPGPHPPAPKGWTGRPRRPILGPGDRTTSFSATPAGDPRVTSRVSSSFFQRRRSSTPNPAGDATPPASPAVRTRGGSLRLRLRLPPRPLPRKRTRPTASTPESQIHALSDSH